MQKKQTNPPNYCGSWFPPRKNLWNNIIGFRIVLQIITSDWSLWQSVLIQISQQKVIQNSTKAHHTLFQNQ